jgi:hypothetical protein
MRGLTEKSRRLPAEFLATDLESGVSHFCNANPERRIEWSESLPAGRMGVTGYSKRSALLCNLLTHHICEVLPKPGG